MPLYYFNLMNHHGVFFDPEGTELGSDGDALDHARQVALELMQSRETKTRSWRLQVCGADRQPVHEMLFATLDRSLNAFSPALRSTIVAVCAKAANVADTLRNTQTALRELKTTLADRRWNAPTF